MRNYIQNNYNINNIQKFWVEVIPTEEEVIIINHYFHWCQRKITTKSSLNNSKCIRIITSGYYKVEVE